MPWRLQSGPQDTEGAVSFLAPLARYIAGHWAMENPKMAANGFSARKSNVREKLSDLFYLFRSFLTAAVNSSRDSLFLSRRSRKRFFFKAAFRFVAINSLERILLLIRDQNSLSFNNREMRRYLTQSRS